ncbi:hypothetical protein AMR41_17775 [Hapalosiphon sp. MRB220]|nr:hypothetical protein AMR41_17775 [Hapalosiphon sp. MRB220]
MYKFHNLPNILVSSFTLAIASVVSSGFLVAGMNTAFAQEKNIPVCQSPQPGEYVLLVISPTTDSRNQLRRALPPELKSTTCKYLNDTVTRIGGFTKIDDANRWARYVNSIAGLSAIITTRPAQVAVAATQTPSFQPQRLGNGFAVLVDYFNRPELANQVKQAVGGDVGFAAYGQRHYLLATYTTNQKDAYSTLKKLSERGFFAVIVDSSKVTLLRSAVTIPQN